MEIGSDESSALYAIFFVTVSESGAVFTKRQKRRWVIEIYAKGLSNVGLLFTRPSLCHPNPVRRRRAGVAKVPVLYLPVAETLSRTPLYFKRI